MAYTDQEYQIVNTDWSTAYPPNLTAPKGYDHNMFREKDGKVYEIYDPQYQTLPTPGTTYYEYGQEVPFHEGTWYVGSREATPEQSRYYWDVYNYRLDGKNKKKMLVDREVLQQELDRNEAMTDADRALIESIPAVNLDEVVVTGYPNLGHSFQEEPTRVVYVPGVASEDQAIYRQQLNYDRTSLNHHTGFDIYLGQGALRYSTDPASHNLWDDRRKLMTQPLGYEYRKLEDGSYDYEPVYYHDTPTGKAFREGNDMAARAVTDYILALTGAGPLIRGAKYLYEGAQFLKDNPDIIGAYFKNKGNQFSRWADYYRQHPTEIPSAIGRGLDKIEGVIDDLTLTGIGAGGVDYITQQLTGKTWGENISELTGWPEWAADFTNPAFFTGFSFSKSLSPKQMDEFKTTFLDVFNRYKEMKEINPQRILEFIREVEARTKVKLRDKDITHILDVFKLLEELEKLGVSPKTFDYERSKAAFDNLANNEVIRKYPENYVKDGKYHHTSEPPSPTLVKVREPFGEIYPHPEAHEWGVGGTSYSGIVETNGGLRFNFFENGLDQHGNLLVDRAGLMRLARFTKNLTGDLNGAIVSSTEMPINIPRLAEVPMKYPRLHLPDVSKMDKSQLDDLLELTRAQPDFSLYSPASVGSLYKQSLSSGALFYPFQKTKFEGFNDLWAELEQREIDPIFDKWRQGDVTALKDLGKHLEDLGYPSDKIAEAISEFSKLGHEDPSWNPEYQGLVKRLAQKMPRYEPFVLAEQLQTAPTLSVVDRYNALWKDIRGYRPLEFNNGDVTGLFPTFIYKTK